MRAAVGLETMKQLPALDHVCSCTHGPKAWGLHDPSNWRDHEVMTVRLIKHEAIPRRGSFEGALLRWQAIAIFYWDDEPSRRLRPELLTGEQAEPDAKRLARAERDESE